MGKEQSKFDSDTILRERNAYLRMPLYEKRLIYPDNKYINFDDIIPWTTYYRQYVRTRERFTGNLYAPDEEINSKVSIWQGDITELEIDAIVNSAARPDKGGQVNQAILGKAGEFYKEECLLYGLGAPGEAMVTGGYRLPAKYVVNTLAPRDKNINILESCYATSLDAAREVGIKSIAFPCIATKKRNGFPTEIATERALNIVRRWLEEHHSDMERVIFCVYDTNDVAVYKRQMQKFFPVTSQPPRASAAFSSSDLSDDLTYRNTFYTEDIAVNVINEPDLPAGASASATSDLPLNEWRQRTSNLNSQEIVVDRRDKSKLFKRLYSIYNDDDTDLKAEPTVTYEGEEGVDFGALTREFFFEALETVANTLIESSPAFEGPTDNRLPCASRIHLTRKVFDMTGKVLAHSILHDGVGLVGLSRAIVYLLSHDVKQDDVEICGLPIDNDDIPDADLKLLLMKQDSSELDADDKTNLREYMLRSNVGYLKIDANFEFIKQELLFYEVIYRRWAQIESMRQGLDELGLYRFLCNNPSEENVRRVFPTSKDVEILPHMVTSLTRFYGSTGKAWDYFRVLLKDIHEKKLEDSTLNTLLLFWTGQPVLPSMYLNAEIDPDISLPNASTCFFRLYLPGSCSNYEEFRNSFQIALKHSTGFGEM